MISNKHKTLLKEINGENLSFGIYDKIDPTLSELVKSTSPKTICDFGCGKGMLLKKMQTTYPDIDIWGYDPGTVSYDTKFVPADVVYTTDVLDHIEPEFINENLKLISDNSKYQYHKIIFGPSKYTYSNGENTRLLQKNFDWWNTTLSLYGKVLRCELSVNPKRNREEYSFLVESK